MNYYYVNFTNADVKDPDYAFPTHEEAVLYLWRALINLRDVDPSYRDISMDDLYGMWHELEETDGMDIGYIQTIPIARLDWEYDRGFVVSEEF